MSLNPEDALSQSPAPWSSKTPWSAPSPAPDVDSAPPVSGHHVPDLSPHYSVSAAVKARKDEYIRKKTIKIKVGTWNTGALSGTEHDLGGWFVEGLGVKGLSQDLAGLAIESTQDLTKSENVESVQDQEARLQKKKTTLPKNDVSAVPSGNEVGLYVLGLQEVVDVTSMTEAVKPFTDPNPAKKWKNALRKALPPGYEKIAEQQLLGLLILIFASPDVAPTISSVSCTHVGTGLMGYLGNKGAVSVRLVLAETTKLCFVNCHLAAGADQAALNRRIWDATQILSRTRFDPVSYDGEVAEVLEEKIGDEDFCFWFGDLNYRLDDIPGEDVRRLLLLHTRNEYDVTNKSKRRIDSELGYIEAAADDTQIAHKYEYPDAELPASESLVEPELDPQSDPASLHTTLQSLLSHDQLKAQQRLRKVFHEGWREGDINFLPTYKYDVGSVGMFDSGEKKRSPSWCDRILFRTRRDLLTFQARVKEEMESRKKDEEMKKNGLEEAAAEQDVLFNYDPQTDGLAYGDDYEEEEDNVHDAELIKTQESYEDDIELDHYISHQRVLSSDHKPLDAIFTLTYSAVIPELKAKTHQQIVREFDKAENEGRPDITVVIDNHTSESESDADDSTEEPDVDLVRFGKVRYGMLKVRIMTVANTGATSASFKFISKGDNESEMGSIAPPWLRVSPVQNGEVVLAPGEAMPIELIIDVSSGTLVNELNSNKSQLDDVLILRVLNGRDYFIPVKGTWMPSCFFRTLDELVTAPEGGFRNTLKLPKADGTTAVRSTQAQHSAPKELFVLTEAIPSLVERSLADWDMIHPNETPFWRQSSVDTTWPFSATSWTFHAGEERDRLIASVRETLDTFQPLEQCFDTDIPNLVRLEVVAETLTSFLKSLVDGIITVGMWSTLEQHLDTIERKKNLTADSEDIQATVMEVLSKSPVHSVSMTFLVFMLTRIIDELAPVSQDSLKSPQSRRSRASTVSSEPDTELESVTSNTSETIAKKSFFPALRRKKGTPSNTESEEPPAQSLQRKNFIENYSALFAPLIIRSEHDDSAKGKDKKTLETRKRRVLKAFLEVSQV